MLHLMQKQHQEEGAGGLKGARAVGQEERAEGAEQAWGSQKKKSEEDAGGQRGRRPLSACLQGERKGSHAEEEEEDEEEDEDEDVFPSFFDAQKKRVECHALADAREQLLAESERCLAEIGHSY